MNNIVKIILSILMLGCLWNMPYGYYQLVRFVAFAGFSYLAYQAYNQKQEIAIFIFGALGLLFQPFFKIALGRELWNIVDVIVAIGLLISIRKK